ncbi:hypothetical protein AHF37_05516 [Paragonimus kellicotti]|nr:hypothetical protein AHF37_05516 [Paragonimus kellicotti]
MLRKATTEFAEHVRTANNLNELCAALDAKSLALAPFLQEIWTLFWQKDHAAYVENADAQEDVLVVVNFCAEFHRDLLVVPVIKCRTTKKEKFAGSDYMITAEANIRDTGWAIQGATSHHLGQSFGGIFDVTDDHPVTGILTHVYQYIKTIC